MMALSCSVSGIRGTLSGVVGSSLTPLDVVRYVVAYAQVLRAQGAGSTSGVLVVGRDARPSGVFIAQLVEMLLRSQGFAVIDIGLTTTPTAQMQILHHGASGGVMITASHNPAQWNALKLLDAQGEFLSEALMDAIAQMQYVIQDKSDKSAPVFDWDLPAKQRHTTAIQEHIDKILVHPLVDTQAIAAGCFKVGIDPVNSTGGLALVPLLKQLGVQEVVAVHATPNGCFARNPEPLAAHLGALVGLVKDKQLDLGLAVDPDVDRLALIDEQGVPVGEDYTLVMASDHVLRHRKGPLVSNLSSTMALAHLAAQHGVPYYQTAVGERHVVDKMKQVQAVIGGEGNGGVIDPSLHYGRDALLGTALILSALSQRKLSVSALRATYPNYCMVKDRLKEAPTLSLDQLAQSYQHEATCTKIDGLHMRFDGAWIHIRPSNTEPIWRLYAEAADEAAAQKLVQRVRHTLQVQP